jgi:ligand-binding sensor domain-containing protein
MKLALRVSIPLTLAFLTARALTAASAGEDPPIKSRAWHRFGTWRQAQGLTQDTLYVVIHSRDGYLWIGTKGGLVRFDGVSFTTFDDRDRKKLRDNEVWSVAEAQDGSIWAGTYGGGASRYKDGAFTIYTTEQGLVGDYVSIVCAGADGSMWFGTDRGVSRFKDGVLTNFTVKDGLPGNVVRALYADRDGSLWIGANNGGLCRFSDGRLEPVTYEGAPLKAEVRWFARGADDAMWIGTHEGVARLKEGKLQLYTTDDGLSSNRVRQLTSDAEGAIWVASDRGLDRLTWDGTRPAIESILSAIDVSATCLDREGSLWVGSFIEGLSRLRRGLFVTYTPEDGLADYYVSSLMQDHRGRMWLGTRGGLNRMDGGGVATFVEAEGIPKATVFALLEDHEQRLWVGSSQGLFRSEGRLDCAGPKCRDRFQPVEIPGHPRPYVRFVFQDRERAIWIGLDQNGVVRLRDGEFRSFTTADGLANTSARGIAQDRAGDIWIGTRGGGLARFKDGRFTMLTEKDGLAGDGVQSVYIDRDDVLWVATRQGLSRYEQGRFKSYTVNDGLLASYVYSIVEDDQGYLWMGSGKGVFRVRKKEFDDYDAKRIAAIKSEGYGIEHGMRCTLPVAGSYPGLARSRDGHLWFGTSSGVSVVHPTQLTANPLAPPVLIEEIAVDDKPYDLRRAIRVAPGHGNVRFRYAGLSFVAPDKMRFKYRLEGYDPDWIDAETRRTAYYTNIPPGRYRFRVKASNNDGVWNETGAAADVSLAPHFYQTYWFAGLCIAGIGLMGAGTQRLRVKRLQAREHELSERVAEALAQVKSLRGLLPICATCKKIRDDKGYWNQMETYIHEHSDADFSHSVCPDCMSKLYPEYAATQQRPSGN